MESLNIIQQVKKGNICNTKQIWINTTLMIAGSENVPAFQMNHENINEVEVESRVLRFPHMLRNFPSGQESFLRKYGY